MHLHEQVDLYSSSEARQRTTHSWCDLSVKSSGSRLPSSNLDLTSTGASSETVVLEVFGCTVHVDTFRGEPRTWFDFVAVASPFGICLH